MIEQIHSRNFRDIKHRVEWINAPEEQRDEEEFQVVIRPSTICNFSCSYCGYHGKETGGMEVDILTRICANLGAWYKFDSGYKKIKFYLHGGEPTSYKHFETLIEALGSFENHTIIVQTNGMLLSGLAPKAKKIFTLIKEKNINIKFNVSFQWHQWNTKNDPEMSMNHFEHLLQKLKDINLLNGVDFMMEDRSIYGIMAPKKFVLPLIQVDNWCKANEVDLQMNLIYPIENTPGYSKDLIIEHINCIRDHKGQDPQWIETKIEGQEPIKQEINSLLKFPTEGFRCEAIKRHIIIDYDFNVYSCFSHMDEGEPLMELRANNQDQFTQMMKNYSKGIICRWKCNCEMWLKKTATPLSRVDERKISSGDIVWRG